ncbi:MAG: extracellular solute-binding protein, partial [Chloroflexota bacterium]|nr:extracellular solute-binding protein [Chloroflexota bacterium]
MSAGDVTRRGLLMAVPAGTVLALAACSGAPSAPEAGAQRATRPARLSWLPNATGNRLTLHQRQVARFKELTGHDVELVSTTGDYMEKLVSLLAAGSAADIFRLESGFLPGLVTKGQLQPLDAYLRRDAMDLKDFFETGITMYQWQNRQYALP